MDYNPFAATLRATDDEIKKLQHRRADLEDQLAWARRFNPEEEADEIARLRAALEQRTAEHARLEEGIKELDDESRLLAVQTPTLEHEAHVGWRVFRLFATEHRDARASLKAHKQEVDGLRTRLEAADAEREQVAHEMAELSDRVLAREQALARYRGFRPVEAEEGIAALDEELRLLETKRNDLRARAADVDRAVEPLLAERRRYQSEIEHHQEAASRLGAERSLLEGQIADAQRLGQVISATESRVERAKLHDECERRFDDRSPGKAANAIRSRVRPLSSSIRDHDREVDRISRDIAKLEERIARRAEVAARDIDALVIDGNNCCYQGSDFIGLAALIPLTETLADSYAVTVVFDGAIRRLLRVSDADVRAALPAAAVHVVATRTKADETILDVADGPTAWVVSNDRFADYPDKKAVKEDRLIKHEIVAGRIFVHDLGVNEPLAVSSLT